MKTAPARAHSQIVNVGILLVICTVVVALSQRAGLLSAFLAADDFQWLAGGRTLLETWRLPAPTGHGFYRPVVTVWFAAVVGGCGWSTSCYHSASLGLHLVNSALMMSLVSRVTRSRRIAVLATLLFALQPAGAQTIAWVSAATELLAVTFYLLSLYLQVLSWDTRAKSRRLSLELGAVFSFLVAVLAHEAAITLPLASWVLWGVSGTTGIERRRTLTGGLALTTLGFGAVTVLANRQNPLFEESGYRFGPHMIQHALDYVVGFYVGPPWWGAYAACVLVSVILSRLNAYSRLGIAWMLLLMLPFLGFTSGNVSRYSYFPAIGFALAIGAMFVVVADRVPRVSTVSVGPAILILATIFVVVRFGTFFTASLASQVNWMEEWRAHSWQLHAGEQAVPSEAAPLPGYARREDFPAMYDQPIRQWMRREHASSDASR
jgi:hypothetical protein